MKGFEYLIHALSRIKNVPFKCHIIGDGPLRNRLQELIDNLQLSDKIFLEGVMDNGKTKEMINNATLFVLSSIWDNEEGQDGIPVVLMEAMAIGTPVISTDISGIPELIEDRKTGLLAKTEDDKDLANKIMTLISDGSLQKKLISAARIKIENEFDINKNTDLLADIFKND